MNGGALVEVENPATLSGNLTPGPGRLRCPTFCNLSLTTNHHLTCEELMQRNRKSGDLGTPGVGVSSFMSLLLISVTLVACGPEEYQKPVQQFREASAVLIATARNFLEQMNRVEQDKELEQLVFERGPIDPVQVEKITIVSGEEITIREKALDELSAYGANLAGLAEQKPSQDITSRADELGKALRNLAGDAAKLSPSNAGFLDNAKFSASLDLASKAVAAVGTLVAEHKARREILRAIKQGEEPINQLLADMSDELEAAYLRQQNSLSESGVFLWNGYKSERVKGPNSPACKEAQTRSDPPGTRISACEPPNAVLMLILVDRMKDYEQRKRTLAAANPARAVVSMRAAHSALVKYANSPKDPATLANLFQTLDEFVSNVRPLGEALLTLANSK